MVGLDRAELPFPTHYQRFTVATFAFLDSGSQRALRGPVRSPVPFQVLRLLSPSPSAPCGLMQRSPDGLVLPGVGEVSPEATGKQLRGRKENAVTRNPEHWSQG